jgi:hypothetical protein
VRRTERQSSASQATRGTAVLVPPDKHQRAALPSALRKVIAEWRNRIETTFSEITDRMELARHRRAQLLGSAHQDRSDHRRPHPATRLPHPGINQPT